MTIKGLKTEYLMTLYLKKCMSDSQEYPANHCLNKEVWDILVFLHLKTVNYSFFLKLTYGVIQQRKWRKCQYLTRCKVEDDNVFLIVTEKRWRGTVVYRIILERKSHVKLFTQNKLFYSLKLTKNGKLACWSGKIL